MVTGPLNGIRILDLTHVWAGPLAVRMLSDLGAEVVKVEAPYGRGPREYPSAPIGGWMGGEPGDEPWNANAIFTKLHRNRRSLCIDLKQPDSRQVFLDLVSVSDVVIENFSARAMPSMGLDYETLKLTNPRIIYVQMPGFGSSGPYRDRVAFGPTVEVMSGLTTMLGYDDESPRNSAMALMDPVAATHGTCAVITALRRRQETGEGAAVEMSLHEAGVAYSGPWLLDRQMGYENHCIGNDHPSLSPHGVYPCAGEDEWLAIACVDSNQWHALCSLTDFPVSMHDWQLEQRQHHKTLIDKAIEDWTRQFDKHTAVQLLQARGISAGPVNTAEDMVSDQQFQARGFFVPFEAFDTPMPGNPVHMQAIDSAEWTPCPRLGEDNHGILTEWLDYNEQQIEALENSGVITDHPPG